MTVTVLFTSFKLVMDVDPASSPDLNQKHEISAAIYSI